MSNEELFTIIREIVLAVTGDTECILENPNFQSPLGEYAAVKPKQSIAQRGQANIYKQNGAGLTQDIDVRAQVKCTAWINFYRGNARDRAERLHQCNKRSDISTILYKNKIGWAGTDAVNDLTELQFETYESRAQIAVTLLYETTSLATINSIESASVIVENESGQEIVTASTEDLPNGI